MPKRPSRLQRSPCTHPDSGYANPGKLLLLLPGSLMSPKGASRGNKDKWQICPPSKSNPSRDSELGEGKGSAEKPKEAVTV